MIGRFVVILVLGHALIACEEVDDETPLLEPDPATQQALNDQIMVDPDLANQNEGASALIGGTDQTIPPEDTTGQAVEAAQEAALELVGGRDKLRDFPDAQLENSTQTGSATVALSSAARAGLTPQFQKCAENVNYSAVWAAKLPESLPVYPRGSTKEAAGVEGDGCNLRIVRFLSPVPLGDVLRFYYSMARNAEYSAEHIETQGEHVLRGEKREGNRIHEYRVYGKRLPTGLTEINLVYSISG